MIDESRIPALRPGEQILWKRFIPAIEVCTVEIGTGVRWLIDRLGWIVLLMAVTFVTAVFGAKASYEMAACIISGVVLSITPLWILIVSWFDLTISGDETYVLTNKRIIRINRKDVVEMLLDSDSISVKVFQTFGDAGTVTFTDFNQQRPCIVVTCKDKVGECCTYLPDNLAMNIKRLGGGI